VVKGLTVVDVALVMLAGVDAVEDVNVSVDVAFALVELAPVLNGMLGVVELLAPVESEPLVVAVELASSEQDSLVLEEESEENLVPCSPLRRFFGTWSNGEKFSIGPDGSQTGKATWGT
jgi:hypothetical protein